MASKRKDKDAPVTIESLMEETGAMFASDIFQLNTDLPVLSTGILPLDFALGEIDPKEGNGGFRARTVVELFGENNSGKSATAEQLTKTTIARFGPKSVVWVASEVPDVRRWHNIGLDPRDVIFVGAYHEDIERKKLLGEASLESLCKFAELDQIRLCVVDSVGAITVSSEMFDDKKDRDLSASDPVAGQAKVINRFIKKFNTHNKHSVLLLVNHYREPIPKMQTFSGALPTNLTLRPMTPGGRGMEFAAHVRILCTNTAYYSDDKHSLLDEKIHIGLETRYRILKNKALPIRVIKAKFDLRDFRWNNEEAVIDFCDYFTQIDKITKKPSSPFNPIIRKAGAYVYVGEETFQGEAKWKSHLRSHPEIVATLAKQLHPLSMKFFNDEDDFSVGEELESD